MKMVLIFTGAANLIMCNDLSVAPLCNAWVRPNRPNVTRLGPPVAIYIASTVLTMAYNGSLLRSLPLGWEEYTKEWLAQLSRQ